MTDVRRRSLPRNLALSGLLVLLVWGSAALTTPGMSSRPATKPPAAPPTIESTPAPAPALPVKPPTQTREPEAPPVPRPIAREQPSEELIDPEGDRKSRERAERLDQWSREAVDASWSADLGEELAAGLRDLAIDGELLEVACRTTLCRIRMKVTSEAELVKLRHLGSGRDHVSIEAPEDGPGLVVDALRTRQ